MATEKTTTNATENRNKPFVCEWYLFERDKIFFGDFPSLQDGAVGSLARGKWNHGFASFPFPQGALPNMLPSLVHINYFPQIDGWLRFESADHFIVSGRQRSS